MRRGSLLLLVPRSSRPPQPRRRMTDRTLDKFLAAGLLAELKGDDGWYTKLAAAADALAKRLADQPGGIVPYLYAALDAKASPEDDAITAARGLLQEQWRSFASAFTSTPILLLRAVILDAIVGATKTNDACSEIAALLIGRRSSAERRERDRSGSVCCCVGRKGERPRRKQRGAVRGRYARTRAAFPATLVEGGALFAHGTNKLSTARGR